MNREYLFEDLRIEIYNLIGKKVTSNSDVRTLEIFLENSGHGILSNSSLRRFFKLIKWTEPRIRTLDVLCKNIGYSSFHEFSINRDRSSEWKFINVLIRLENNGKIEDSDMIFLKDNLYRYIYHIGYFFYSLISKEKFDILNNYFEQEELLPDLIYQQGEISDIIGLSLRKLNTESLNHLISYLKLNDNLKSYCLYFFVDYSGFNGWYLYVLNRLTPSNAQEELFKKLVNKYFKFLRTGETNEILYSDQDDLHPILKGRYIGYKILHENDSNYLWDQYNGEDLQSYLYEIFPVLILRKKWKSIIHIEKEYLISFLKPSSNTFSDKKFISLLSFSIARIFTKEFNLSRKYLRLIKGLKIINSHNDFFHLLCKIPEYHLEEDLDLKDKYLNDYLQYSSMLGFHFLNKDFLIDYFKKPIDE